MAISICIAATGCEKPLSAAQKQQAAYEAAGVNASVIAAFIVSAARSCEVVGFPKLEKCAEIKSVLLADQSAQTIAKLAVDQLADFRKACSVQLASEECEKLIKRAVEIEYRKPRTVNQDG